MADVTSKIRRLSQNVAEATVAVLGTGKVAGAEITAAAGVVTIPAGSRIAFGRTGLRPPQAIELTEDVDVAAINNDELYARQLPGGARFEIAAAASTPIGALKLADLSGTPVDTVVDTSPAQIGSVDAKEVAILDAAGSYAGETVEAALAEIGGGGLSLYANLRDEKPSGTLSGTFTQDVWQTRDLNTKAVDEIGITLAANQFTLPAGTYRIWARAPAAVVGLHKAKLRNITDGADEIIGESGRANSVAADNSYSQVDGQFTITASKTFELQHQSNTTRASNGFGIESSFGVVEVFASIVLIKVA